LKGNGLREKKTRKNGKTRKKVKNSFRGTPVFLQKGLIFRSKRTGFERRHLQVLDDQMLAVGAIWESDGFLRFLAAREDSRRRRGDERRRDDRVFRLAIVLEFQAVTLTNGALSLR
jgi:hypothetical protein